MSCKKYNYERYGKKDSIDYKMQQIKSYIVHVKHLLVLFTKSIFWFCEDLIYKIKHRDFSISYQ